MFVGLQLTDLERSPDLSRANQILAPRNWDCRGRRVLSGSVGSGAHLIKPLSRLSFGHHGNRESEKGGEQRKMNEADAQ